MGTPYHLNANVATVLAQNCCYNNQLPQGAPTSPMITKQRSKTCYSHDKHSHFTIFDLH